MSHKIKYAALCHKGKIRDKNQDNLWCSGVFLEKENKGLPKMLSGVIEKKAYPAFAVFDGLGGEQQGEVAAYLAAKKFDERIRDKSPEEDSGLKTFLLDTCFELNQSICDYAKEQQIKNIGTTAALLMFGSEEVVICNLGDSRVYRFSKGTLEQISIDHIVTYVESKKPPLAQHLGIPKSEFIIEPFITEEKYNHESRYLICSDGLSDMLTDDEIGKILADGKISAVAKKLMNNALKKGGKDNITVIVCEATRIKTSFMSKIKKWQKSNLVRKHKKKKRRR